ncbi:MAG: ribosome rescue protein RqcH [Thermoproteota archaeon]
MTSFDIAAIVDELGDKLSGARITNVYHLIDNKTIILRLRLASRNELLVLQASRRLCLTQYDIKVPKTPSQFAMLLRKELNGGIVEGVMQLGFDRIVSIKMRKGSTNFELLVELLPRGNILLLENRIIKNVLFRKVMKDRRIERGQTYKPPPSNTLPPYELRGEDIEALRDSGESIGRSLAKKFGYGPPYADEICIRAGVKPDEVVKAMDTIRVQRIVDSARQVYRMSKEHRSPRIYRDKFGKLVGFSPFELFTYSNCSSQEYDTMSSMVDDYFAELETIEAQERVEKMRAEREEKIRESKRRLKETADGMLERAKKLRDAGNIIFSHLNYIQSIIDAVRTGKEVESFGPVKVLEVKGGKDRKLKLEVSGTVLELLLNIEASKSASSFFEEAKRLEEDYAKIVKKIEVGERLFRSEEKFKIPEKRKRRAWFENYRWFISSDGILVVCAKDATSNEALVRKYANPNNPVLHSEAVGAPFVLVQADSENVPQNTLDEAAQMAASFTTRAWQAGYSSLDVFWVRADQLTKTPPSGEYLSTGAFVVKGKKNYIRGSKLILAVGVVKEGDGLRVVAAPARAVESKTANYVKLIPGNVEKKKLAQIIKERLVELAPSNEKDSIRALPLGEILSVLPGRSGRIL